MERTKLIRKAVDFLKGNETTHLVTVKAGFPLLRPMGALLLDREKIYVCTGASSRKIKQIEADRHVALYAYSEKKQIYCTISGFGKMRNEKNLRKKFWKKDFAQYFPKGVDDPEYCFIEIEPRCIDYVDYSKGFDKPRICLELW